MKSIALAATFLLSSPVFADTYEQRLAIATEYAHASVTDMDFPALIKQMYQPILDQANASGKQITPEQIASLQELYMDTFEAPMRDLLLKQDVVMAEVYTLEEITALHDFYQTTAGRSVMLKMPKLLEKQQPMIIGMITAKMPEVVPAIQEILK
ncbi:hypothetical protein GCM10007939_05670 [Amylibacter marinus]|uniref:DUF2059 domain-containing protein n=1 Tax=Amylibacter marinus TaxID=1475483 RepID=A0ABQ5VSH8_9RHOB|nr:DUF2059 domain-containing protein [Amylibacter marinus]GLQ34284.1 hypothetical protein GCM10007939_05670 [Amylibacter marinus]